MGKMYGTINVREVHARDVKGCEEHNRRQYESWRMPDNIDFWKTSLNEEAIIGRKTSFKAAIGEKLKDMTVRKNAVHALEYILGASPEFFEQSRCTPREYLEECLSFIADKHGQENLVATHIHYDEKTPHMHVLVTPVVKKEVKWKNRSGQGKRMEHRLCARDFTGHPDMLRKLQNDFYEHIVPIGKRVGIEFTRYTSAQEQVKTYSDRVDHRIDKINELAKQAKQELEQHERLELQRRILLEKEKLDQEVKDKIEAEKRAAKLKKINEEKNEYRGPKMRF